MAKSAPSAHPLETLCELTTALEAAVLETLAKPGKKAVHHLRTTTRRIEAQLELLAILPEVQLQPRPRDKALSLLKDLRHAAGQVRDLDVQRDLIAGQAAPKNASPDLLKEVRELRHTLKTKRNDEADNLLNLLQKRRSKLPLVFKDLLDSLKSAESHPLTEPRLISLVHDWYTRHCGHNPTATPPEDPARLHDIRKTAKLARYLAESAPKAATKAHRLATRYGDLQQAGGQWHDWLLLAQVASDELGKSSKLAKRFNSRADRSLRTYKRLLKRRI